MSLVAAVRFSEQITSCYSCRWRGHLSQLNSS